MQEFLEGNSLFVVLSIVIIIWIGISLYLFLLDRKVRKLERTVVKESGLNSDGTNSNSEEIGRK
jgi:CcmD family protein